LSIIGHAYFMLMSLPVVGFVIGSSLSLNNY